MVRLDAVRPPLPAPLALAIALCASPLSACASVPTPATPPVVHAPRPDGHDRYPDLVLAANDAATRGDFGEALTLANDALHVRPFGLEAGLAKVESHLALGQRIEAADFAGRLVERHPTRVEAHYARGKALYALGRLLEAQDAFAEGLRHVAPQETDPWCALGLLTAMAHDTRVDLDALVSDAHDLLAPRGRPAPPQHYAADVWHALAMAQETRDEPEAALVSYGQALALAPDLAWAHYNLALLLRARGSNQAARPHLVAFLEHAPRSAVREIEAVKALLKGDSP